MPEDNTNRDRIVQHGRGAELFVIFIVNVILTILTLGIYRFWAITRNRRYLWSQTEIEGHRLEYTGQGLELLIGFAKVLVIFLDLSIAIWFFPARWGWHCRGSRYAASVSCLNARKRDVHSCVQFALTCSSPHTPEVSA